MVPWGNKANVVTYYTYPLLQSENKYSMSKCTVYDTTHFYGQEHGMLTFYSNPSPANIFRNISENKINNILNNYYVYASGGTNNCGFLAQNSQWRCYPTKTNGYGTLFQDNYEDKPEIRCRSYAILIGSNYTLTQDYYDKNGNASNTITSDLRNNSFNYYRINYDNPVITTYKTSTAQYQGMLPVFNA